MYRGVIVSGTFLLRFPSMRVIKMYCASEFGIQRWETLPGETATMGCTSSTPIAQPPPPRRTTPTLNRHYDTKPVPVSPARYSAARSVVHPVRVKLTTPTTTTRRSGGFGSSYTPAIDSWQQASWQQDTYSPPPPCDSGSGHDNSGGGYDGGSNDCGGGCDSGGGSTSCD